MTWNWQQPDWPRFSWDASRLAKAEERFLFAGGRFLGTVQHVTSTDRDQIVVDAMSTEAVTTSEIEGELLNRDSVQSSIRRQLGLATDNRRVAPAEQGISEVMVDLYRNHGAPLDEHTLFSWHERIMNGRTDLRKLGRYRTHAEPMQVVSGAMYEPKVHFEAPPSRSVPREMRGFLKWFQDSAPAGTRPLPILTRAGIAHLYFESIHPFEDGNGRIGRAISEKVLAQGLGQPSLIALAATILIHRREYYQTLELSNKDNKITAWLAWFAGICLEAQQRTIAQVEFVLDKARLLGRYREALNARQLAVLLRVLREGPEGFKGGLSAGKYATISKASPSTATRDLADLVGRGALIRTGEKRHARYHLPIPLRQTPRIMIDLHGNVVEGTRARR